MQSSNKAVWKVVITVIIIILILLVIGAAISGSRVNAPTAEDVDNQNGGDGTITVITSTSSVESDMDAYINASSSVNPNDFNDSYSDLNP